MPLSLSDEELRAIQTAASAVPVSLRHDFLRRVAAALGTMAPSLVGPGTIAQVVRELPLEPQFRPNIAVGPLSRKVRA
jgi:hypothetical protein